MAVLVNIGGKDKRVSGRFGGDSAWRQHRDDNRATVRNARRRAEQRYTEFVLQELDTDLADADRNHVSLSVAQPLNGIVRDGSVDLVYSNGRIIAAHCV